jgi:putative flippase GtrA
MSQVTSMEKPDNQSESWVLKTPFDTLIVALAQRLGRGKPREMERFLKFATVGLLGAMIDFGLLNLLQATVFSPSVATNVALATTVAFIAAVTSNFILNRYWTYPDSRSRSLRRQLMQFVAVSAVGWFARTIWVTLMFAPIGLFIVGIIHTFSPTFIATSQLTKQLGSNGAQLIAIFVVMIWNFFINRYWTYNDID